MAIYGEDTDWGRSFGNAIKGQLEEAGWETVAEEYFGIDQTEFYPLLNKFVDLNPAVVAGTSTAAPTMSAWIKQADEVGLESLIIADGPRDEILRQLKDGEIRTADTNGRVADSRPDDDAALGQPSPALTGDPPAAASPPEPPPAA